MPAMSTRRVILLSAFAAALALGLIAWTWGPWILGKKISAGAIELSPAINPHLLQGSFMISTSFSKAAIPSNGTGGACLVADLNRFDFPALSGGQNRKCTKNSDCMAGLPARWSGYCDVDRERICWVRPGPDSNDLCNKSPFEPWKEDVDHPAGTMPLDLSKPRYPGLAPLESFSSTYPGPVRWRILACLNGKDLAWDPESGENKPACAAKDASDQKRRLVFGPIRVVPPDTKASSAPKKPGPHNAPNAGPNP